VPESNLGGVTGVLVLVESLGAVRLFVVCDTNSCEVFKLLKPTEKAGNCEVAG